jgi:hypothetical protein
MVVVPEAVDSQGIPVFLPLRLSAQRIILFGDFHPDLTFTFLSNGAPSTNFQSVDIKQSVRDSVGAVVGCGHGFNTAGSKSSGSREGNVVVVQRLQL